MDKISVIIPTYNRASTIEKSISSVLRQTYSNLEIIVVDDGSTDNTCDIVKSIKDNRIKYYSYSANKGACYARNFGIKKATGEYIAFQDSDDEFKTNKLEEQLKNLKANNSDMDFCSIKSIINKDNYFILPEKNRLNLMKKVGIFSELSNGNFISTQAIFGKTSVFREYLFDENLPRFQDYDLVIRIASRKKISFTNKILVNVYRQPDSISNNYSKLKKACYIILRKNYGFNEKETEQFYTTLFFYGNSQKYDEKVYQNFILKNENDNLKKEYEFSIKELEKQRKEMKKISVELNKAHADYNNLYNSKRVKLINKFFKIFGK